MTEYVRITQGSNNYSKKVLAYKSFNNHKNQTQITNIQSIVMWLVDKKISQVVACLEKNCFLTKAKYFPKVFVNGLFHNLSTIFMCMVIFFRDIFIANYGICLISFTVILCFLEMLTVCFLPRPSLSLLWSIY